jgi:hypothetical protein
MAEDNATDSGSKAIKQKIVSTLEKCISDKVDILSIDKSELEQADPDFSTIKKLPGAHLLKKLTFLEKVVVQFNLHLKKDFYKWPWPSRSTRRIIQCF